MKRVILQEMQPYSLIVFQNPFLGIVHSFGWLVGIYPTFKGHKCSHKLALKWLECYSKRNSWLSHSTDIHALRLGHNLLFSKKTTYPFYLPNQAL